jgi:hypothetical protein
VFTEVLGFKLDMHETGVTEEHMSSLGVAGANLF